MHNKIKLLLRAKPKRNRVEDGKTFCGHNGGSVVNCRPGECYRLENLCRHKLKGLAEKHYSLLQFLYDHSLKQSGDTGVPVQEVAVQQYGDIVGALVGIVAEKEQRHA